MVEFKEACEHDLTWERRGEGGNRSGFKDKDFFCYINTIENAVGQSKCEKRPRFLLYNIYVQGCESMLRA